MPNVEAPLLERLTREIFVARGVPERRHIALARCQVEHVYVPFQFDSEAAWNLGIRSGTIELDSKGTLNISAAGGTELVQPSGIFFGARTSA